ncbi:MAG: MBL fold metallo-hydrolase [Nanoarchaeota archaeon]|nr:MBL fold metallo-hydrolase [Nanoarchaeota archaeon]
MFEVSVLASGSSGNCFYIGSDKGDILIDAGISCKQISQRLEQIGKDIRDIKGIFVTHEHGDHTRGIDVLTRKYNIPVYINKGTLRNCYLDKSNVNLIKSDEEINLNGLKILPFSKSHEAADPVSYLIKNKGKKVSIITDIGYSCDNVIKSVAESDLVILESNHDTNMLKNGSYPHYLKKRIGGDKGHLSNYDAGLLVLEHGKRKLQYVLLSHLSLNNNTPDVALNTFNSMLRERKDLQNLKTMLTYREKPTELIRVK